jgi:choline dehydrogenase-like flavoprotein
VDGSFFLSSGAVNPTLTIIANALRVGDQLLERLEAKTATPSLKRSSQPSPLFVPSEPLFAK